MVNLQTLVKAILGVYDTSELDRMANCFGNRVAAVTGQATSPPPK